MLMEILSELMQEAKMSWLAVIRMLCVPWSSEYWRTKTWLQRFMYDQRKIMGGWMGKWVSNLPHFLSILIFRSTSPSSSSLFKTSFISTGPLFSFFSFLRPISSQCDPFKHFLLLWCLWPFPHCLSRSSGLCSASLPSLHPAACSQCSHSVTFRHNWVVAVINCGRWVSDWYIRLNAEVCVPSDSPIINKLSRREGVEIESRYTFTNIQS